MSDLTEGRRTPARRSTRRTWVAAAAVVTLFGAAGCGGGDDDAEATTTTAEETTTTEAPTTTTTEAVTTTTAAPEGVCEIVTEVDILAAVHVTMEPGVESTEGVATVCNYQSADGASTASIALHDPAGSLLADTLASDPNATESTGTADGAVLQLEHGTITVLRHDKALVITVVVNPAATEVALVQRARVGAGHLQV